MHFALPPRKSSSPPPYARASTRSVATKRRQQLQYLSYIVLCLLSVYLLYSWLVSVHDVHDDGTVPKDSSLLIVTVFNEATMSEDHMAMVKTNRDNYATRHGYQTYYTNTSAYKSLLSSAPASWAPVPALRHALTVHPHVDYVWLLTPHALITNTSLSIYDHIFRPLPSLMIKDIPVVPPDSVIHTFSHLTPGIAYLILTQDLDNLAPTSFLLRNTLTISQPTHKPQNTWTQYFLDAWFDPLYRAYAFQKAENHALEHIVQWHPTILANLVIIPQRRMNSYNFQYPKAEVSAQQAKNKGSGQGTSIQVDSMWQAGDLLVNFKGCEESPQRDCEKEMKGYFERWKKEIEEVEGKPLNM